MYKYEIGIDEAGRGPLAGPVAVGLVLLPQDFDWASLQGVNDSKLLTQTVRERLFHEASELRRKGRLRYTVSLVGPQMIDRIGITSAVRLGINRGLRRLAAPPEYSYVKLDGLLRAPKEYVMQETIIKGDQKEKSIGLASIMAKVTRDRLMVRLGKKYPDYGFEQHKGYGTRMHQTAIKEYGICDLHRRSYTHFAVS